jgi:DNA-binding transcriptional ArsR family regulator
MAWMAVLDSTGMESYFAVVRYHGCVELGSDIALIAGLIGEPARALILVALVDGALPAGELAFIGNVAPQTASFHLRKLMEASLITVEKQGKHSYYRLANDSVASALESLAALAPARDRIAACASNRRESERVKDLRFARSCYKHLAGVVAVEIHKALLDRGFLAAAPAGSPTVNISRTYRLTESGQRWWREFGMILPASARPREFSSRACIDWTERRHHLGGALGAALFSRLKELRWIAANPGKRPVRVTHLGARELERQLGITVSR